ncbi:DUF397 domain-containing protein [Streptomyces tsukubensis]|uniref:DUF397 domain-containing protein n=1 Tax=Streptomyces tsukubensis TaxID=83656 RepID=UPI0036C99109
MTLGPASAATWFKSSYSNDSGGNCVEIADLTGRVGVRDSKEPGGPVLLFGAAAFARFLAGAVGRPECPR